MAATSSPLSSPPFSQPTIRRVTKNPTVPQYRPARELPFELWQHTQIYFEEQLFAQALTFLTTLMSSGATSFDLATPTTVPAPTHLAIAATLAVHPAFTNRTTSKEKWDQANASLRLLRLSNKIVGPVNANFSEAFTFHKYHALTSRHGNHTNSEDSEDDAQAGKFINTPYSTTESLFTRAEDFWQIVGWALSCSCLPTHATRWTYWQPFLETLLGILEADWYLQLSSPDLDCHDTLLYQYVELASGHHGKHRRIMRAIFADGSTKSLNEFYEVFRNELKPPKSDAEKLKTLKREVNVNVDNEVYGDYMAKDDDELSDENSTANPIKPIRSRSSRRVTPRSSNTSLCSSNSGIDLDDPSISPPSSLGPPESVTIRLRLLHLLSNLSGSIPESFIELDELYTLFVEFIKPLPLPTFQQLISPSVHPVSVLSADAQTTLCEFILQRMLESAAPSVRNERYLTQRKLETEYLPFAASRGDAVSNAKVSLLIEASMRRLWLAGQLVGSDGLRENVARGVRRRCGKVGDGSSRKKVAAEEEAWNWLVESGERMAELAGRVGQG